ncbi:uncharacterized protein E0L32_009476 [Thyridium curvatum]|uniref:Mitochondrial carrier protein n=1 Tax=Thyridium curvatum TaxID=1093900 RepID=A0A507ARY4_9PEZI|nr:uncharacterized protein E0L32_009476 [Thyridium curvatum]TPX09284.1 hypothetical protein E0L32_009476 [Thyridium curvatum]
MPTLQSSRGDRRHDVAHDDSVEIRNVTSSDAGPAGSGPVEITAVQKMLSATTGSFLTGFLMTPLDVVRVRWQAQGVRQTATDFQKLPADLQKIAASAPSFRPANLGVTECCREVFFMNNTAEVCIAGTRLGGIHAPVGGIDCAVEQTQQRTYSSTLDGLRKIARNEGVTTLWRGLSPTLLMAIPGNIIYFTGYEWLRFNHLSPIAKTCNDLYAPLVAGSVARVLAAAAVSPIELFRTRLQASHGSSAAGHVADTLHSIREMVGLNGYRSLWRGLNLTLWRDVPFSGMYWWGYETIRGKLTDARERHHGAHLDMGSGRGRARRMSQSRENHTDTFVDSFTAGAMSGAIAAVATTPFDVGKTRTQVFRDSAQKAAVSGEAKAAPAKVPEEQRMARLLWHIFRTEGMQGLFRGWIPRTLKVAPSCAIMISTYELGKRLFRDVNEKAAQKHAERDEHRD